MPQTEDEIIYRDCHYCQHQIYQRDGEWFHRLSLFRHCDAALSKPATPKQGVCRNGFCGCLFTIQRLGQEFCSALCSRRQRQREYFEKRGKVLRQQRHRTKPATPKEEA